MTDKAYAVPLHELLARVPRDARLVIDDPDGMGTQYIPVGRHCHEAAEELRARLAQLEPVIYARKEGDLIVVDLPQVKTGGGGISNDSAKKEWVGLTDAEYEAMAEQYVTNCYFDTLKYAKAIEAKLRDKNS